MKISVERQLALANQEHSFSTATGNNGNSKQDKKLNELASPVDQHPEREKRSMASITEIKQNKQIRCSI